MLSISVPLTVPKAARDAYRRNYSMITRDSGHLMLFAGDQKVEHLNADFFGPGIHPDDRDPEHLFQVASKGKIGVFATQLGLISRYAIDYPEIPYLIKLNSKTNLVTTAQADPLSTQWMDMDQLIAFGEDSGLDILGVGYTIYLGSKKEAIMLREAAQLVLQAHKHGLVTVLWIYPRGEAIADENVPHLIAGATGVAAALGSDFVKVSYPKGSSAADLFKEAVSSAGRTGVVCAGGSSTDPKAFLQRLYDQIHISGAAGNATGRNIHQKSLKEAVRMCDAIYAITVEGRGVDEAMEIFH